MASDFEQIVTELHAQLADSTLDYGVLRLAQVEHAQARRVTWIPISFEISPVDGSGPVQSTAGERALYIETWLVEAHIVGDSFEDAELIRLRLLDVARRVLGKHSQPIGGVWVTQALNAAAHSYGGLEKIVLRFRWKLDVLSPLPAANTSTIVQVVETTVTLPTDDPQTFTEPSP